MRALRQAPFFLAFCIFGVTMRLAAKVENLRRTRDLLLPRLLSGQIDVEAMPA